MANPASNPLMCDLGIKLHPVSKLELYEINLWLHSWHVNIQFAIIYSDMYFNTDML